MHSEGYGTLSVCVSLCMSAAILAYRLQVSLQVRKHEKNKNMKQLCSRDMLRKKVKNHYEK